MQRVSNSSDLFCFFSMWESDGEPDTTKKSWDELSGAERTAAGVLGYNKKKVRD